MLSLMGTCAGVAAISSNPEALWFTVKITAKALETFYLFLFLSFFFASVKSLMLIYLFLLHQLFPSSRLLLFPLKRLWSPTDPGDLHRTSLVKCLGWIRREGRMRKGRKQLLSMPLFTHSPIGKRWHPAVEIDSSQDSTPPLKIYLVFCLVHCQAFAPPLLLLPVSVIYLFSLCLLICNSTLPRPSL